MSTYVICSSKVWNTELHASLSKELRENFVLMTKKEELSIQHLRELKPKAVFFTHWSSYIPQEIYSEFECIVFHMTDLPFGRGGSPLQNLIKRGIKTTKISALQCVQELDAGPIYLKRPLSLEGTAEEIFIRTNHIIESMIKEIVKKKPRPKPQKGKPTYFTRLKKGNSDLSSLKKQDLATLFDHIRMLDAEGYPQAYLEFGDYVLEFTRPSLKKDHILTDVKIRKRTEHEKK